MTQKAAKQFSAELRERAVRMVQDREHEFARRIVGWRVSRTAHASFVLGAPEQALHERRPAQGDGLAHHSDRGSQGGFKWLSQHRDGGWCDGGRATFGSGFAG